MSKHTCTLTHSFLYIFCLFFTMDQRYILYFIWIWTVAFLWTMQSNVSGYNHQVVKCLRLRSYLLYNNLLQGNNLVLLKGKAGCMNLSFPKVFWSRTNICFPEIFCMGWKHRVYCATFGLALDNICLGSLMVLFPVF